MRYPKDHMVKIYHNNGKPIVRPNKIGNNDFCHCGSGRKFKKCCQERQIVNAENGKSFTIKKGQ